MAAAHESVLSIRAFLAQYDKTAVALKKHKAASRRALLTRDNSLAQSGVAKDPWGTDSRPASTDEELGGSATPATAFVDPWGWLIAAPLPPELESLPRPKPVAASFRAADDPLAPVGASSAGTPDDADAIDWVLRPNWSSSMSDAIDNVITALEQAVEEVDDSLCLAWQQSFSAIRDDAGLLEPLHRPMLAARKRQFDRRASRVSAQSASSASTAPLTAAPTLLAASTLPDQPQPAAASGVVATATSAASAVSIVAAGLGRSAFKRITAAGMQVKKGIANIAALASGLDADSSQDSFPPEGEPLPQDLQDASENRLHWVPLSLLDQVGSLGGRECICFHLQ